jgi:hypothetical protein
MKRIVLLLLLVCAPQLLAQNLPPADSSRALIADLTPRLAALDSSLNAAFRSVERGGQDIILTVKARVINAFFTAAASRGTDDCLVKLLPTKAIWSDTKSLFGVTVRSSLDIDSGSITVDLKQFTVPSMTKNILESQVELEGSGLVAVTGQSAGVPGHAVPRLDLYMQDRIRFACIGDRSGAITLRPEPATVLLKAKLSVKLWGFDVPYYKEIPLAVTDLVPAFTLPLALSSTIHAPRNGTYRSGRMIEYADYAVSFSGLRVWANNGELELRTNITIH